MTHSNSREHNAPEAAGPGIFSALEEALERAEAKLGKGSQPAPLTVEQTNMFAAWFAALSSNDSVLRQLRGVVVDDREALCKRISDWIVLGSQDPSFLQKHPSLMAYCQPALTHFATRATRVATTRRLVSATVNPFGLPTDD